MKLAEALQERADINSRLAELYPRLSNNAIVQEGEKPAEDPQSLIDEIESCTARLAELIARINLTIAAFASMADSDRNDRRKRRAER